MIRAAGICLAIAGAVIAAQASAADSVRTTTTLDDDWRFHLGAAPGATEPDYDDTGWPKVDVPHDYVIAGSFEPAPRFRYPGMPEDWFSLHGFLSIQPAVYRKTLELCADARTRRLWLEFDGVFSNSRYWLNGREIGRQYSGYARSRFDITDFAASGKNILVVQVDPRYDGWWYEGGGIFRHVRLVTVAPLHVAPDGVFVRTRVANPGGRAVADAVIGVQVDVDNGGSASASATVTNEIVDSGGHVLDTAVSTYEIGAGSVQRVSQIIPLARASLWSPSAPSQYRLRTTVAADDRMTDQVTTTFGVRELRFDPDLGLFLNGKHLVLQGVNLHEDHAGVGIAVPDRLFTWRLERLKEVGCNAIRFSHNPVEPFLLDECDRLGFLVIAENRHLGDLHVDQTPKSASAVKHRDLTALVMRDRNHPSIMLWSLCNEQWIQASEESAAMARAMKARVHELDPTRPVTAALNGGFDSDVGLATALDVIGINYHPDVYDAVHRRFPRKPMLATEIASEVGTRGIYSTEHWDDYFGDRERGYVAAYSINPGPGGQTTEHAWPPVVGRAFMAGGFVWAAFDYKGEPRPFGWPVINSHYGFMDVCGFPKDSYYYYKAWWTNMPVVHLFPHWNWAGKEGQEIPVWVDTNCREVELFLNGRSLGKQAVQPLHHLEWKVKYAPGRLVARATSGQGDTLEASVETTGEPAAIRLRADRSALAADNADLAVVTVEIVDARGRVVPTAGNKITFALTGPAKLIGVGNGDPSCHEPDKAASRSAFSGLAQALVQATHRPGEIVLQAASPGLRPAQLPIESL